MHLVGGQLLQLARVDDEGARYPLRVDPLVWTQTAELVAGDGETMASAGAAVAVSGDTAIVGAPYHEGVTGSLGSAYVFVRSGAGWTQEAELAEPSEPAKVSSCALSSVVSMALSKPKVTETLATCL